MHADARGFIRRKKAGDTVKSGDEEERSVEGREGVRW